MPTPTSRAAVAKDPVPGRGSSETLGNTKVEVV